MTHEKVIPKASATNPHSSPTKQTLPVGGTTGRPEQAVSHEWQEEEKLCRFFNKLFGETVFLGAQRIEFTRNQDALLGELIKDGGVVKSLAVKALWLPLLRMWLVRRSSQGGGSHESSIKSLPVAVRVNDQIVTCSVSYSTHLSGDERLVLDQCRSMPLDRYLVNLTESNSVKAQLERIVRGDTGTIVVCSQPGEGYMHRLAPILSISGGGYLGDLAEASVRRTLESAAQRSTVIVSIETEDPSEALLHLRSMGLSLEAIQFRGVVASATLPKGCRSCAKAASVDPSVLAAVPDYLREITLDRYAVGRGCDTCGHNGYSGTVSVFSIAAHSAPLSAWFQTGGSHFELVQGIVPQGLRPLFEECYRCATDGHTTIEAVFRAVRGVPQVYIDHWKARTLKRVSAEPSNPNPTVIPPSPSHLGSTHAAADSSPLFPGNTKEKSVRAKPVVLVVEDDEDQRSILELVLRGANYEVELASNGAEALKQIEQALPDLIVSDLMMPVMDGSQMVEFLKQSQKTSQVPILMLTMVADEEREYALLNLGADDYCEKTIQRKVLLKRVENLLKRSVA